MDAARLAQMALDLADDGYEERVAQLVQASDGDTQAVLAAAEQVRETASKAGTREHIAFTYLSAAFGELADPGDG